MLVFHLFEKTRAPEGNSKCKNTRQKSLKQVQPQNLLTAPPMPPVYCVQIFNESDSVLLIGLKSITARVTTRKSNAGYYYTGL